MSARTRLLPLLALALLSAGSIIGMLLVDNAWDYVFLSLAASPLIVGAERVWRQRKTREKATP